MENKQTVPQHRFAFYFIERHQHQDWNSRPIEPQVPDLSSCTDKPEETHRSVGVREALNSARSAFLPTDPTPIKTPLFDLGFAYSSGILTQSTVFRRQR
jgi:hypothetical protein